MSNTSDDRTRQSPAAAAPAGPSPSPADLKIQEVSWVFEAWKRALEAKDWTGLVELIGLPEIYITGHPEESGALSRRVTELTADLCDFEVIVGDIFKKELTPQGFRVSFNLRVLWSSSKDWEDYHFDVVVHAGFAMTRDVWRATHLGIDRATTAPKPLPPVQPPRRPADRETPAASAGAGAGARPEPASSPAPQPSAGFAQHEDRQLTDDAAARAAADYFTQARVEPAALPKSTQSKKAVVYMPVIIDADVLRDLLG